MTPWVIQSLGILTLVIHATSLQMRKKETLLLLQIGSNLTFFAQCALNHSPTGAVIALLAMVRTIDFFLFAKIKSKPGVPELLVFLAAVAIITQKTWEGPKSLFAALATSVAIYSQWLNNMKALRLTAIAGNCLWLAYQFNAGMYIVMLSETGNIVSSAVALWRYRRPTGRGL
jgi:hypothetical protein